MKKCLLLISTIALFFATGCNDEFPAISTPASGNYNYGTIVWRDLATPDPYKAAAFYNTVFGWTAEETNDGTYWIFKHQGKAIGGMLSIKQSDANDVSGEWICSISVPDVDEAVAAAVSNSAVTLMKAKDFTGRGRCAVIKDPQGAVISFLKSSSGDPAATDATEYGWLWTELWSNDLNASNAFYTKVIKTEMSNEVVNDITYTVLKSGGKPAAGIIRNPVEGVRSHWVPYVLVSDPMAVAKKAGAAGAKIIQAPSPMFRNSTVALLLDPTGAPLLIQKYSPN